MAYSSMKHLKTLTDAGTPPDQAEAQVQILDEVMRSDLATKDDLKNDLENLEKNLDLKMDSKISKAINSQTILLRSIGGFLVTIATTIIIALMPETHVHSPTASAVTQKAKKPSFFENAKSIPSTQAAPQKSDKQKPFKRKNDHNLG